MTKPPPSSVEARPELDALTIARAQRRDETAYRALFRHYKDLVFSFLWRMLGPRAGQPLVEDLLQETFLRVFRGLSGFSLDGPARLSTWILTIATRLALNELRKSTPTMLPLEAASLVESNKRADEESDLRSLGARLQKEIEQLDPQYRVVFLLREYHDLSYEEIAKALEIELGTVKSRLARAREALRDALKELRDA